MLRVESFYLVGEGNLVGLVDLVYLVDIVELDGLEYFGCLSTKRRLNNHLIVYLYKALRYLFVAQFHF